MFDDRAVGLKGLRDELDQLASSLDPAALDEESVTAYLVSARWVRDRVDGLIAQLGAPFCSRRAWAAAGARSPAAHLASFTGELIGSCRADLRLARSLASMPLTAAALSSGALTRAHAERLAGAAGGSRRAAFVESEELLVGLAQRLDGHDFGRAVSYWVQVADDDAAEAEADRHDRDRSVVLQPLLDGRIDVRASMTRAAGAELATALDRIAEELRLTDRARARERLGREPAAAELERTDAQRRHDALVVMARRALAAKPGAKQPRPSISFVAGSDQAMFGRLCELGDGTVVTPGELARHLAVADLERVVFEAPDRIRVSERTRLFRGAERRAVELRDRYCTFPGCRVPADDCEIDHVIPDARGGPTTQENGEAKCEHHHPGRRSHQPWLHPDPASPDPDPVEDDTS